MRRASGIQCYASLFGFLSGVGVQSGGISTCCDQLQLLSYFIKQNNLSNDNSPLYNVVGKQPRQITHLGAITSQSFEC